MHVGALRRGLGQETRRTLRDAAEAWLAGAKANPPTVRNRNRQPYKPSVIRGYEADLTRFVLPEFGGVLLGDLRRSDVQRLVDELVGAGHSSSKVRNIVIPIRVIYRHALRREEVTTNPTLDLELPSDVGRRERTATAAEGASLIAALPKEDRALWATAFYAGLRRGELRALRWEDVNLAEGKITVGRSWDEKEGEVAPKSKKGERTVPLTALLRDHLIEAKARTGRDGRDFVFGAAADRPFTPSHIRRRAAKAWAAENQRRTEKAKERGAKPQLLEPIGLHECRHTFVSLMADAGISLERIGDYVGHASTYMVDRYRHLVEGREQADGRQFDDYLARADTGRRVEQLKLSDETGGAS
jgi:integrase